MISKAKTSGISTPPPSLSKAPDESWNTAWPIARRLLEARRQLRGTKLWETFSLQRDFEAFSIHTLALGVEEVLNSCGVISCLHTTKWHKQGNITVVEGVFQCMDVDHGTVFEVPVVGEGVDDSDKGLGKASSYARKQGMINALNLGIGGLDNEASDSKASTPPQSQQRTMGGAPQRHTQPAPVQTNGTNLNKSYRLKRTDGQVDECPGSGIFQRCWAIIQNAPTTETLDAWAGSNEEMFRELAIDNPAVAHQISRLVQGRLGTLRDKGI